MIVLSHNTKPDEVCSVLMQHGIPNILVGNVEKASRILEVRSTAFVLLDMELEGAETFLDDVAASFYDPPPYLLVTSAFFGSVARTAVLNRGADVCLEKPLDAKEVYDECHGLIRRFERNRI